MKKIDTLLLSERTQAKYSHALLLATMVTGLIAWVWQGHSIWSQWNGLIHVFAGLGFCAFVIPYLFIHFKRTVGFRRSSVLFSGLLLSSIIILTAASGIYIAWAGQKEANAWLANLHSLGSASLVLLLIVHVLQHWLFFPAKRKTSQLGRFPSVTRAQVLGLGVTFVVVPLSLVIIALITPSNLQPQPVSAAVENYSTTYGPHPFRPSQTEVVHGGFVAKHEIADSLSCGNCHQEITQQWLSSMHREAASDPAYEKNISLLVANQGIEAARYCEGCHAPVALLTGELSPGGEHGGIADSLANFEGVSCMSCHGISEVEHLKGVASYRFSPATPYLFDNTSFALLNALNSQLIRINPSQHKKDMAHPVMSDPKMCASCHVQFMDKDMNKWGWVQMQNDYKAWAESPFSQHHDQSFANDDYQRCQDCHMPMVKADDPSANKDGNVRSHFFAGANTFLPLLRGDEEHYIRTRNFLQSNRVRLQIDKPSRQDLTQSQQIIDESLRNTDEAPFFLYLGETAEIDVVITNQGVGHNFPGGTIDINEVWVEFSVTDASGQLVYSSGAIDEDDNVDADAQFYRSLPVDRNGQLVWKHDLFNMVGESFKRVIPAGESDILRYTFSVPSSVKSPLVISAKLNYRKLNARYAKWALEELYFPIPVVEIAWDTFTIPIKIRKNVTDALVRN